MNKRAFACCVFLSVTFFLSTAMLVLSACGAAGKAEEGWVGDRELASLPEPAESLAVMPETAAEFNTEEYDRIYENEFLEALSNPLSTVSIDVDTASYSNVRRFINDSQLPPQDAVRIEELINYFSYDYPQPEGEHPFSVYTEVSEAPWNLDHRLVHIGLQGLDVPKEELPNSNLVFLLDVSGSMNDPNKLPLVKSGFKLLTEQLGERDRVAIVVYAGAAGQVLPSTNGENKAAILDALEMLEAGGSTAGGQGIELAYRIAAENFIEGGNNRVILATDGDFNVGPSSDAALIRLIEEKREQGIFLSVLGFGSGNLKDSKMEQLADKGNGNYYYIDSIREAKKVLAKEDFADDTKDAGELGAGTAVTFLYEIIPAGADEAVRATPELKYQDTEVSDEAVLSNELLTVSLRYKLPDGDESTLITQPVLDESIPLDQTSDNFRFAAAVAEFGMLLRDSAFKGDATYQDVGELAQGSLGDDEAGFRFEFLKMVETAELLD
jgi:Ca-activated chloride channel family protein